jgi:hypothetical protein
VRGGGYLPDASSCTGTGAAIFMMRSGKDLAPHRFPLRLFRRTGSRSGYEEGQMWRCLVTGAPVAFGAQRSKDASEFIAHCSENKGRALSRKLLPDTARSPWSGRLESEPCPGSRLGTGFAPTAEINKNAPVRLMTVQHRKASLSPFSSGRGYTAIKSGLDACRVEAMAANSPIRFKKIACK